MQDRILESLFLDVGLWAEVIDHGIRHGVPAYEVERLQDPHFRAALCRQIACREYVIAPPHTGYCPKDDGRERMFLVNAPMDRLLLHAVYKWLSRHEPAMIHPSCLSYQEGIGIGQVVKRLSGRLSALWRSGRSPVLGRKYDVRRYFESVGREAIHRAFDRVERDYGQSAVIDLLRRYYDTDVYYDSRQHQLVTAYQGIKQGCAVSSWLANVLLYDLDEALSRLPGYYVRYSDDIIYVGEDYLEATQLIATHLRPMGLALNEHKIEDIVADRFVRFLGYGVRGEEITLSTKWVRHFQDRVDRLTIRNPRLMARVRTLRRHDDSRAEAELRTMVAGVQRKLSRYLYYGDGHHSWASVVLGVVNRKPDIDCLNRYCLDALRAVSTGQTRIGGLGFSATSGILRGKGKHVKANLAATGWMQGFRSMWSMKQAIRNPWLYRALVAQLLDAHPYPVYGTGGEVTSNADRSAPDATEMTDGLEECYATFLDSEPDGGGIERFYARGLADMDTCDLLCAEPRSEAREHLQQFLMRQTRYDALQPDPEAWYWQSGNLPQLVVLRQWFEPDECKAEVTKSGSEP